ncbi:hypothetical protein EDD11_006641 [Mortierella claussenii]|nr:hypothetical protein EDD11_006641 [Mortierella claussenii]
MTVGGFDFQEFQSGPDTYEVRVIPGTALTQGRPFVMWEDVKDVFPLAARLQCGRRIISFMVDENGNRLLPLRVEYHPNQIIQVIMSRGSSLQAPPDTPLPPPPPAVPRSKTGEKGAVVDPKHGSYIAAFTLESAEDESIDPRHSFLSTWSISDEAKNRYRSSVYLYESFLQSIQTGHTEQANLLQDDFRAQFFTLEAEMSRNQALQQQMLEMQQSMLELQQQALDKLNAIQTRVQAILIQKYALLEYPIPRLFIVLPRNTARWDPVNIFENKFRIHFLCECGEHTRLNHGSKMPHHIHLAKHEGYDIENQKEFFRFYGSYVLTLLHMFKYGVAVAGFTVPALAPAESASNAGSSHEDDGYSSSSGSLAYGLERSVDLAMEFLECMSAKNMFETLPTTAASLPFRQSIQLTSQEISVINGSDRGSERGSDRGTPQHSREIQLRPQPQQSIFGEEEHLYNGRASVSSYERSYNGRASIHSQDLLLPQGPALQFSQGNTAHAHLSPQLLRELGLLSNADLRQLAMYLKVTDSTQLLGDLYRCMNREGTARWVCADHYREAYGVMAIKELREAVSVNDGQFDEHLSRVDIALSSATIASLFYRLMERSRLVQDLKVELKWDVSMSDLKALRDAVNRLDIACLDLTCTATTSTSDYLNRNKRSDPLWELIMNTRLQAFLLSNYVGFFTRVTVLPKINNLRVLRIGERISWKKEGPRVVELIAHSPRLKELRLNCAEMEEAYTAVKKTNLLESCSLEHLTIDGFEYDALQARFENGLPAAIDLVVSDLKSVLLSESQALRTLHLRPGIHVRKEIDPHFMIGIINRNHGLIKLTIQCMAQEFLWWHTIVRNAIAESVNSTLTTLRLHGGRNQLLVSNLHDDRTTDLQLMTINMPSEATEALLKLYGTKVSKLKIEGDVLKYFFEVALHADSLTLRQVDITASCLTPETLYDLRLVLRRCQSTLQSMSISMDVRCDGSERSHDLADFVAEFRDAWGKISMSEMDGPAWKHALTKRGYVIPSKILILIPAYVKSMNNSLVELENYRDVVPKSKKSQRG